MENVFDPNDYDDDELREMVLNPEDWHKNFVEFAKEILDERGATVSASEFEDVQEAKTEGLKFGKKPNTTIFTMMWFISALGGLVGIIAGYFYWRGKVKGPDGKKYFNYNAKYRQLGSYILLTGVISTILQFFYLYYR